MENYSTACSLLALLLILIFISKPAAHMKYIPKLPPGQTGLPIIGCLIPLILNKPTFRWIHKMMDEMNTEIACIRLGRVHAIFVSSPELARQFLKKHDAIFSSRPDCMSARLSSNGYLTAVISPVGDQWKKMRRVLASNVLSPAIHHWLHDKRMMEADHLVRYVYNQCMGSSSGHGLVNVRIATQHYCGNVIRRLTFNKRFFGKGAEDGGPGHEEEEHVEALFRILSLLYGFSIADYFPWLEIFYFGGHKRDLKKAIQSVTKLHDPEIHDRIEMWKNGMKVKEEDILDVFINLKDSKGAQVLTVEEIKAQIIELMFATVDNPSNAVEWALAEMINQPEILKRACEELDMVVGRDKLVQESDLKHLNYVKACAREAFRLHPLAPFNVPHVCSEDTTVAGYYIPKGSHVILSRPGLGRNPRAWEQPLKYKPERHLGHDNGSEIVLTDSELNMFSFSTGRRGCPGVLLGSTITTMLLARPVHGFTWNMPPDASNVDLSESESEGGLFLAEPLLAVAKPRLPFKIYEELRN